MKIVRLKTNQKTGFTMIEILVVIFIIAILAVIAGSIVGGVVSSARTAATRATIKHLEEVLHKRLDGFSRHIQDLSKKNSFALSGIQKFGKRGAIAMWRKEDFKDHFPQYIDHKNNVTLNVTTDPKQDAADAAEIFYDFIVNGETFGTDTEDTDQGPLSSAIGDTDDDGRKEFIDAWGHPLRFYRWPTRLIKKTFSMLPDDVNAANSLITSLPTKLNEDKDDPLGILLKRMSPPEKATFRNEFHDFNTFHIPLIVSAGPDGELGLYEPLFDTTNFGHLANWFVPDLSIPAEVAKHKEVIEAIYDNITNHNQQAGSN